MVLNEALEDYNNKVKDRLIGFKLSEFIGVDSDLHNYSLSEFINMFKIKRMAETGRISEDLKDKLIYAIRKYNTKELELKTLKKSTKATFEISTSSNAIEDLIEKYTAESKKYKDFLMKYGIDVDVENNIKLENIIDYDIDRKSIYFTKMDSTKLYSQKKITELSQQFLTRVLKLTNNDKQTKENLKLYNLAKIEFLVEEKYINSTYKDDLIAFYEDALKANYDGPYTEPEKIENDQFKELTGDPFNLVFKSLEFDFTSFIDYLIKKDARMILGDARGVYEDKLSTNIR